MTTLELTKEQTEKLQKLDGEMQNKAEYEIKHRSRKEESSKRTGVPYTLVDMDVIKIGTMLGLIKNKAVLEGKEEDQSFSLLNMFLGTGDKQEDHTIDFKDIPFYFKHVPKKVTEGEKIQYHSQLVNKECTQFSQDVKTMIDERLHKISERIAIFLPHPTLEAFVDMCIENIQVLLETIEDTPDEDDADVLETISIIRNCLLGPMSICKYKQIVADHIMYLRKMKKPHSLILQHLSWNESRLVLYPGFQRLKIPESDVDIGSFYNDVDVRCYTKAPELKEFNFDDIIRECCVPSLISIPIEDVLVKGLIGPYRNNSVGFLSTVQQAPNDPWAFYILKSLVGGARLWVVDYRFAKTTVKLGKTLLEYMINLFKVFYKACFGNNNFRAKFYLSSYCVHADVFRRLLKNITYVNDIHKIRQFLTRLLIGRSTLIPTELDLFNTQELQQQKLGPKFIHHPYKMIKDLFQDEPEDLSVFITNNLTKLIVNF